MPPYSNTFPGHSIAPGDSQQVMNGTETVNGATPFKSDRVALANLPGGEAEKISVRVAFGGAPGAFSWQLETSDTDVDTDYVIEGAAVSALGAGNVCRKEYTGISAKFARLNFTALANAVSVTAELSA
jgi:hypothetical protein